VDHITVRRFAERLEENIEQMHESLKAGKYQPQKIKRVNIPKAGSGGSRPLGIPTVRDRVVQTALCAAIEPIFENEFAENSYGFRPGRNCKDALRKVDRLIRSGYDYVVEADIKSYFDSIPHEELMEAVGGRIADGRVLQLVRAYLQQGIIGDLEGMAPEVGTPQGGTISPLLSNLYLHPLDKLMEADGYTMIRYADDFVVLCQDKEEARKAMETISEWMKKASLELNPAKTKIVNMREAGAGFDFLGYHFERTRGKMRIRRWPSKKSQQKMKAKVRGRTRRCNGGSLEHIISQINPILKGWFEYFKHSNRRTFIESDGWTRMRLRSILRKRRGGRGRGRGGDHNRWTNSFFAEHGLFSLTTAHGYVC